MVFISIVNIIFRIAVIVLLLTGYISIEVVAAIVLLGTLEKPIEDLRNKLKK